MSNTPSLVLEEDLYTDVWAVILINLSYLPAEIIVYLFQSIKKSLLI